MQDAPQQSLKSKLLAIAASGLLAVALALLQNILSAHGVSCSAGASPATAGVLGMILKHGHDLLLYA